MSVVKINAISVPEGAGEMLEERFASRKSELDKFEGFEGFELLRPVGGEDRYFVYTRWASEEAFLAWRNSEEFARSHAGQGSGGGSGGGHPGGESGGGHPGGGHPGGGGPVASGAHLLEFEVALEAGPGRG